MFCNILGTLLHICKTHCSPLLCYLLLLPPPLNGCPPHPLTPIHQAIMEAAISSTLSHPNVVQTYTYTIRPMRDTSGQHQQQGSDHSQESLSKIGIVLGGAG